MYRANKYMWLAEKSDDVTHVLLKSHSEIVMWVINISKSGSSSVLTHVLHICVTC